MGKMSFFNRKFEVKRYDIGLLKPPCFNMRFLFKGNAESFGQVKTNLGCMPAKKYRYEVASNTNIPIYCILTWQSNREKNNGFIMEKY